MLRSLFSLLLLSFSLGLSAQFTNPISWTFRTEHVSGDEFLLIAESTAEDGFAVYSQFTGEGGPVPTLFTWSEGDHYELIGKVEEKGHKKTGMDDLFGVEVIKFLSDEPVTWTQRVKIKDYTQPIEVTYEWMCCDDEQCLPPTDDYYTFELSPVSSGGRAAAEDLKAAEEEGRAMQLEVSKMEEMAASDEDFDKDPPEAVPTASSTSPAPAPAPEKAKEEAQEPVASANAEPLATYEVSGPEASEYNPVSWVFQAEQLNDSEYRLNMVGHLSEGWTIYSKDVDPTIGPIPTLFQLEEADGLEILGELEEKSSTLKVKYDKAWDAKVAKINGGTVTYSQVVRVAGQAIVKGFVEFQTCDDEMCLPPKEVPFALDLTGTNPVVSIDGLTGAAPSTPATPIANSSLAADELGITVPFNPEPIGTCSEGAKATAGKSLWSIFGLGFIGGLLAMLMPCIFPMIPLTVSFFTKSGGSRAQGIQRASLYGFFIFMIYVLLSLPFHLIQGLDPGLLNNIASSVPLNIIFFVVFMFFAGSFFGFYELTLPESWSNRASRAEGTGGISGIFFMALTLALVSFSCTGPILGSLLVESVSGGAWPLTAGMAGFGVALGLPFALFAAFPGFLNNMPKSGGWLNSVKVVLGFVEVALAFKFLSTADLVGNWNVLRIEPFLLVWILCAVGIAIYLLGFISFPLDSKKRKKSPFGIGIAAASLLLAGYLAIGLTADGSTGTYHGRKLMSGIAPPVCYNFFLPCDENKNITPFKDLNEGLAYARKVNKPVMIDFTGYSCVNCRLMEEHVWTEDNIKRYLTDEFVVISLYVDDREPLPEAEHREVDRMDGTGRTRIIDNVGKKWQYLEQSVYSRISQPYYVLVSPEGQTLNPPVAYTADADIYEDFLECGLNTYRAMQNSK